MAYNYFPTNYQPMQYQQPTTTGLIWVQGEEAARAYLVAPGNTVVLWDSEKQVAYIKSADASGMPTIKILDYTIRQPQSPQKTPLSEKADYITREEFEALKSEINALREERKNEHEHDPAIPAV